MYDLPDGHVRTSDDPCLGYSLRTKFLLPRASFLLLCDFRRHLESKKRYYFDFMGWSNVVQDLGFRRAYSVQHPLGQ